jgi:hypothetical protein
MPVSAKQLIILCIQQQQSNAVGKLTAVGRNSEIVKCNQYDRAGTDNIKWPSADVSECRDNARLLGPVRIVPILTSTSRRDRDRTAACEMTHGRVELLASRPPSDVASKEILGAVREQM